MCKLGLLLDGRTFTDAKRDLLAAQSLLGGKGLKWVEIGVLGFTKFKQRGIYCDLVV